MKRPRSSLVAASFAILVLGVAWIAFFVSAKNPPRRLVLATTTSVADSGLLGVLLPPFERERHLRVDVLAVGTGQALAIARRGDADALLVHAPGLEQEFVRSGYGVLRTCGGVWEGDLGGWSGPHGRRGHRGVHEGHDYGHCPGNAQGEF
ncbi:MAG: substrate-binding domain-containing protein [Armatimonadota bacterium]|nr:substrate-binding domain-containing protein [Armatimonadota bacterium]MDR5703105.1 substrate-binding domain-containing protein [Armatimonadota bacterium]